MANIENLEDEVEDLKKQIAYLSKVVIPSLNAGGSGDGSGDSGGTGGSGSTGGSGNQGGDGGSQNNPDPWVKLYDMNSEDPALNLGFTEGIKSSAGRISTIPNLEQYNALRFFISFGDYEKYFVFDTSFNKGKYDGAGQYDEALGMRFFGHNYGGTYIYAGSMQLVWHDDIRCFEMGAISLLKFVNNKVPTVENASKYDSYKVESIEGRMTPPIC